MQPRIKMGLIVGAIGFVFNICISAVAGVCGPFLTLFAGGLAGFLAAQQEKLSTKGDGARAGAVAGGIAGALMLIAQIIGGLSVLIYVQMSGMPIMFGSAPSPSSGVAGSLPYYAAGLAAGFCFGILGVVFAAGAGAGAGYFGTPDVPASVPPQMPSL